jgi:putative membrane protein
MIKAFYEVFTGFLIGGTMSVPGISGGTTAIALGCYEKILGAASDPWKKNNFFYLLKIFLGGLLGFFSIAGLINAAFQILPLTMTMVFCGAVGAGIFLLGKETVTKDFSFNSILLFLLGMSIVLVVEGIPQGETEASPLLLLIFGFILAAGVILPGISTSHLLLVFGLYDNLTQFSKVSELLPILPLIAGCILGILLLTKPLAFTLERYPIPCRWVLLGFAVGSMKALITPCVGNEQISYLLWFQILNGLILAIGAGWGILKLNRQNMVK